MAIGAWADIQKAQQSMESRFAIRSARLEPASPPPSPPALGRASIAKMHEQTAPSAPCQRSSRGVGEVPRRRTSAQQRDSQPSVVAAVAGRLGNALRMGSRPKQQRRNAIVAKPPPVFRPLPAFLVFPNLISMVLNIFLTGLAEASAGVLVEERACGFRCMYPAIIVLALIVIYLVIVLAMLLHFNTHHRRALWQSVKPQSRDDVEDPILRLFFRSYTFNSKAYQVSRRVAGRKDWIERSKGEFMLPDEETAEPERTRRLLARPFALFRPVASDAYTGLSQIVLSRASGLGLLGLLYDWITLTIQIVLAVLLGLGDSLEWGSTAATIQIITVLSLQVGTAALLFLCAPGWDRFECALTSLQFLVEGLATTFILIGAQDNSLTFALFGIFVPILLSIYDGIIVQMSLRLRSQNRVTCGEVCTSFIGIILMLPTAIMACFGVECDLLDRIQAYAEETMGVTTGG